jgi:hypothetical protein
MARIRTIKPEFFKNEQLADLPMSARLLFIGLWTLADKEGRLEDRPKRIKVELFPYDNLDCDKELSRLQSAAFIERYEVGELKVIQIINFTTHQRITGKESETDSKFPAITGGEKQLGNIGETFGEHPGEQEGKGKERKGKEGKGNAPPVVEIIYPFDDDFKNHWEQWKDYKRVEHKFQYKSPQSEQASLSDLVRKSGGQKSTAIAVINQSVANGWKGFFELKNQSNGAANHSQQRRNQPVTGNDLMQAHTAMFGERRSDKPV